MSLINCEECNTEVSDKAASCPKCGAPINTGKESKAAGANLKTIQETSKKFKIQSLISIFLIIGGLITILSMRDLEPDSPTLTIASISVMIGIIWYIVNRFRIWWHHK